MRRLVEGEPPQRAVVFNYNKGLGIHRLDNTERLRSRAVGFNPFRQQDKTRADVVVVIVFILITLIAVLWAFLGG